MEIYWLMRVVAVVVLLGVAAAIATPKGRLPLALRGVRKILRKDSGATDAASDGVPVPGWRKSLAFVLVLIAVAVSCLAAGAAEPVFRAGDRVAWIGDSITSNGHRQPWGYVSTVIQAAKETGTPGFDDLIGLGYGGWHVYSWHGYERRSLKDPTLPSRFPRVPTLGEVFTNRLDVIVLALGINDHGFPTFPNDDLKVWQAEYDRFIVDLRERCHPRQFVLCNTTAHTCDRTAAANLRLDRMNALIRELAAKHGARYVDLHAAIWETIDRVRTMKTGLRDLKDLIHPMEVGNAAMARQFGRDVGEPKMAAWLTGELERRYAALDATLGAKPRLVCQLRPDKKANVPGAAAFAYDIPWNLSIQPGRGRPGHGDEASVPGRGRPGHGDEASVSGRGRPGYGDGCVSVEVPAGWRAETTVLSPSNGLVRVTGCPDRLTNPVRLTARLGDRTLTETVEIPAPWFVSPDFPFAAAWKGNDWQREAVPPVRLEAVTTWRAHTPTWDFAGDVDPGAIDLRATNTGYPKGAAYVRRRLFAPHALHLKLVVGTTFWSAQNGLSIRLDGKVIGETKLDSGWINGKAYACADKTFALELAPGWHDLTILTANKMFDHFFHVRILDAATGKIPSDLRLGHRRPLRHRGGEDASPTQVRRLAAP